MKRTPTLDDLDNFASNLYVTPEMIYKIAPLTRKGVRELVQDIVEEMQNEGLPPIRFRPMMVPTYRVMERLGLRKENVWTKN